MLKGFNRATIESAMVVTEVSLRGFNRRKSPEMDYFEARFSGYRSDGRFYCTKIKSPEEGALCYDITQLYSELEYQRYGKKRKAAVKLNYEEYSRSLRLEHWPSDFDIRFHKEVGMEKILKQAQDAAKNLPESLRRSTPVVGSPSPSNRSLSNQNVHGKPLVAKQDLPGDCTNQLIFQEISELSHRCFMSYTSKVIERETLEGKVAEINENFDYIGPPESCLDDFTSSMAHLKQLMTIDGKSPGILEMAEQGYNSNASKCLELRKLFKDHNSKAIPKRLERDTWALKRANKPEWLLGLPEDCPSEEQTECGVSALDSEGCGPPGNHLVDVLPFGTDTTTLPAEMGVLQRVVPHEFHKVADENVVTCEPLSTGFPFPIGFRREEEDGSLPEVWNGSNPEMPISQWSSVDWIDSLNQ